MSRGYKPNVDLEKGKLFSLNSPRMKNAKCLNKLKEEGKKKKKTTFLFN